VGDMWVTISMIWLIYVAADGLCPGNAMNVVKAHADIVLTSNSEMEQFRSLRNDNQVKI
jgi:hydroxymethylpyrimidine pyrophosphatase-like HAD family hydrolase